MPVASLSSNFLISQGKSNVFMYNTMAQCLVQMLFMVALYPYGVEAMVVAYVVVNILWVFAWHFFVRRTMTLTLVESLRDMFPFMVLSLLAMAAAWGASLLVEGHVALSLLVKVVVAAVTYLALMWMFGAAILKECFAYLRHRKA